MQNPFRGQTRWRDTADGEKLSELIVHHDLLTERPPTKRNRATVDKRAGLGPVQLPARPVSQSRIRRSQAPPHRFRIVKRLKLSPRNCLVQWEWAHSGSDQPFQRSATTKRKTEIMRQGSDVGPPSALHPEDQARKADVLEDDPVHRDASRLTWDLVALAGELIEAAPLTMERGEHWRDLLNLTSEGLQRRANRPVVECRHAPLLKELTGEILGVGDHAEPDCGDVLFVMFQEIGAQFCGGSHQEEQDTGRVRNQRPSVPDLWPFEEMTHMSDHPERGHPWPFVHHQDPCAVR